MFAFLGEQCSEKTMSEWKQAYYITILGNHGNSEELHDWSYGLHFFLFPTFLIALIIVNYLLC